MMKRWFQILVGDNTESTPADIISEIEALKIERAEVQALADVAAENLSNARLAVMGGDVGRSAEIKNLEKEIVGHDSKLATLAAAIDGLQDKLTEATERERQAQIAEIDKQIQDLREFAKKFDLIMSGQK